MAVTGRSGIEGDLATQLMDAEFVRVAPRADGDAIAAAGLLLRALATRSTPFQARVVPLTDDPPADDSTIPIGFSDGRPATAAVVEIVRELESDRAIDGAGQSSWGPVVYGITDRKRVESAHEAGKRALSAAGVDGEVRVVAGRNRGAKIGHKD